MDIRERIAIEPGRRGGKPCIRDLRITVFDILEYLAAGMREDEILSDFPQLERDDIKACLLFAAERERCWQRYPAGENSEGVDYRKHITIEPDKMGGKPCIRGMRITIYDVLGCLASGMSEDDILRDFPYLVREDIRASLAFAADGGRGMFMGS
ncbi:MAG TPA: DUF433 domain-containing protein [Terriglobales bacterium]|nr:DUF433 domain-containing protein [Terriglobales bacterium]